VETIPPCRPLILMARPSRLALTKNPPAYGRVLLMGANPTHLRQCAERSDDDTGKAWEIAEAARQGIVGQSGRWDRHSDRPVVNNAARAMTMCRRYSP
jgi:hypothetical protein